MRDRSSLRVAAAALWIVTSGCTAMRELPRDQYALKSERKQVQVMTATGLRYEFDYAVFGADSLTGFRRRDTEERFEEFDSLSLPYEGVSHISTRRLDWYRTGLVGGAALAAVVAAALSRQDSGNGAGDGGPPKPPPSSTQP